jgi:predicted amidophosphoribosyltransferase
MPSARKAIRTRGRDATLHLARAAAAELRAAGIPTRTLPLLRHGRRVADQAGLDRSERAANLAGALKIPPRWIHHLEGAGVVLVDDVVTTGATLTEGARVVRGVGAHVLGGATVAAARFVR